MKYVYRTTIKNEPSKTANAVLLGVIEPNSTGPYLVVEKITRYGTSYEIRPVSECLTKAGKIRRNLRVAIRGNLVSARVQVRQAKNPGQYTKQAKVERRAVSVARILDKLGIEYERRNASSTNSVYFRIVINYQMRIIRVSDHPSPPGGGWNLISYGRYGPVDLDLYPGSGKTVREIREKIKEWSDKE